MFLGMIFVAEQMLWIFGSLYDTTWIDQRTDLFSESFFRYKGYITPDIIE